MVSRVRLCLGGALLGAVMVVGGAAHAATVTLQYDRYDRSALGTAQAAMSGFLGGQLSNLRVETFEDYQAWNGSSGTSNPQNTKVGSFTATGGTGSGGSVVGDGSKLQVREDEMTSSGRYNTNPSGLLGGNWLDSNDNEVMEWRLTGIGQFNVLAFLLLDAADVGGRFSIKVGDTLFSDIAGSAGRLANGNIHFVRILLDEAVDDLTIALFHDRTNDGFGIDGVITGRLAVTPLPPAALLLGSGIAVMGVLRRRRRARS